MPVLSLGASDLQLYRKRHLVPFGETIPGKAVFGFLINRVLAIPLADQTPGAAAQPPFLDRALTVENRDGWCFLANQPKR